MTDDLIYLTLTVYGEARGENLIGQVAVAFVILNRSRRRKKSIKDICIEPYQFSCWNSNDPNRKTLDAIMNNLSGYLNGDAALRQCMWVAKGVLENCLLNPIGKAEYYVTKQLFNSDRCPSWAKGLSVVTTIGNHVFLADPRT